MRMSLFLCVEAERESMWGGQQVWTHGALGAREEAALHLQSNRAPWDVSRQVTGFDSCLPKERAAMWVSPVHRQGN